MDRDNLVVNLRSAVNKHLMDSTDFLFIKDHLDESRLRNFILEAIDEVLLKSDIKVSEQDKELLAKKIVDTGTSFGPLRPLMEDPTISEIMVNNPSQVYIQKNGLIELTDIQFEGEQELIHTIQRIMTSSGTSRRLDGASPFVSFSLNDGSRINIILPPVSLSGPAITIRKFAPDINNIDDLIQRRMFNEEMATLLIAAVEARLNIVFCGATGTGKTTLLNILSNHIPKQERIITIEQTGELRLRQEHVISLQSREANIEGKGRVTVRELFINSLKMRPDRIILGELLGEESFDLIQAISSGHVGSLAVVHANSPKDCLNRLATLVMMSGINLGASEIKNQIAHAIDMIVHVELSLDGHRRIASITDVYQPSDDHKICLDNIFSFQEQEIPEEKTFRGYWLKENNKRPSFYEKFTKSRVKLPVGFFE